MNFWDKVWMCGVVIVVINLVGIFIMNYVNPLSWIFWFEIKYVYALDIGVFGMFFIYLTLVDKKKEKSQND